MTKLIDANNLIDCLQIMSTKNDSTVWEQCIEIVNSLPDEHKHGYWVTTWNRYDKDGYVIQTIGRCSCCNQYSDVLDYCGNCGAKMDGEE